MRGLGFDLPVNQKEGRKGGREKEGRQLTGLERGRSVDLLVNRYMVSGDKIKRVL